MEWEWGVEWWKVYAVFLPEEGIANFDSEAQEFSENLLLLKLSDFNAFEQFFQLGNILIDDE